MYKMLTWTIFLTARLVLVSPYFFVLHPHSALYSARIFLHCFLDDESWLCVEPQNSMIHNTMHIALLWVHVFFFLLLWKVHFIFHASKMSTHALNSIESIKLFFYAVFFIDLFFLNKKKQQTSLLIIIRSKKHQQIIKSKKHHSC